jgi:hypothetical protein
MQDTQREFDISVEAIQREAEQDAVAADRRIIPPDVPKAAPVKRTWLQRFVNIFR